MNSDHRTAFDHELSDIETKVVRLFALVAADLPVATKALLHADDDAFETLADRDSYIDALYAEIERLATREILLQAPVASDLRFLLTVLRVVPELERSHDLVVYLSVHARELGGDDFTGEVSALITLMGTAAAGLWQQAADAWCQRDRAAAEAIIGQDDGLSQLRSALVAELHAAKVPVPVAMEMALVARDYERLGAHAVNIARRVIYLVGSADRTDGDIATSSPAEGADLGRLAEEAGQDGPPAAL